MSLKIDTAPGIFTGRVININFIYERAHTRDAYSIILIARLCLLMFIIRARALLRNADPEKSHVISVIRIFHF